MTDAYIGLGANLGDAAHTLRAARDDLARLPLTRLLALSHLYRTAPVGAGGPDYTNAVAKICTGLAPLELLRQLQAIEQAHGRTRPWRNAPRTLDLDLLLFGTVVLTTKELTLPHPRLHERAFVLAPLAEIEPELTVAQGPVRQLLASCSDQPIARMGALG